MERQEHEAEHRYDTATQEQIIALAARLQEEHTETLSAGELERIGEEVGIQPAFVQEAIRRLAEETAAKNEPAPGAVEELIDVVKSLRDEKKSKEKVRWRRYKEQSWRAPWFSVLLGVIVPLAWAAFCIQTKSTPESPFTPYLWQGTYAVALLTGFLVGSSEAGCLLSLATVTIVANILGWEFALFTWFAYGLVGSLGGKVFEKSLGVESKAYKKRTKKKRVIEEMEEMRKEENE